MIMLITQFCINIAFFWCRTYFSHIATSLHTKQLNIDSSYGSLVAAASLNTTSKLGVIRSYSYTAVGSLL